MPEITYTVEVDDHDQTTIWHGAGHSPIPLVWPNGAGDLGVDESLLPILTAVLAPTDEQIDQLAKALHDWNPIECKTWDETKDSEYGANRRSQVVALLDTLRSLSDRDGDPP